MHTGLPTAITHVSLLTGLLVPGSCSARSWLEVPGLNATPEQFSVTDTVPAPRIGQCRDVCITLTPRAAQRDGAAVPMMVTCLLALALWAASPPCLTFTPFYHSSQGLTLQISYFLSSLLRVCPWGDPNQHRTISYFFDRVLGEVISFHWGLSCIDNISPLLDP